MRLVIISLAVIILSLGYSIATHNWVSLCNSLLAMAVGALIGWLFARRDTNTNTKKDNTNG